MSFTCEICNEELPSEHGLKIHRGKMHSPGGPKKKPPPARPRPAPPAPPGPGPTLGQINAEDLIDETSPYAGPAATLETPPQEPPNWRERIWGDGKRPAPKKPPVERRPRTRRLSTEGIWTTAWTGAGVALVRSGADVPVGNCLQFQAPIVGDILDEAVAGTFLDKVLQPIAGGGERLKKVSSVLAMPILVAALERSPGAAPVIEPLLRQAIREHLVAMAPVIKARQKAEENYRKALTELGMDTGDDPIDSVIDAIFPKIVNPDQNGASTYAAAS